MIIAKNTSILTIKYLQKYGVSEYLNSDCITKTDTNKWQTADGYSGNVYDIDYATKSGVIYPSLDPSIFELKYPNIDIEGRSVGDSTGVIF